MRQPRLAPRVRYALIVVLLALWLYFSLHGLLTDPRKDYALQSAFGLAILAYGIYYVASWAFGRSDRHR